MAMTQDNNQAGQLQWLATATLDADASEINLFLDPLLGLMDMDFHQVMGANWDKIKADTPKSTASLSVSPEVKTQQLLETLEMIQKRGGYHAVVIFVQHP